MKFVEILNNKKFTLIGIFLFLYFLLNLLAGERGLISYYEKKNIKENLIQEKKILSTKLELFEKKINLLTDNLDLDYLEMLYRMKFMVGKKNETIYVNNNEIKTSRKN
tara:strand:+ start:79 stop:402 length:324 start_codon:yes stop_codon:yes gene_type:complete